jgi:hypothetical protein
MSTNTTNSIPASPAREPGRKSLWIPRSPLAAGVLLLTLAAAAWPFILAAAWSYINATGCFFDCIDPDPTRALAFGASAVLIVLSPFAAVRWLQSERPASVGVRLGVILLADAAAIAFSVAWLWPR